MVLCEIRVQGGRQARTNAGPKMPENRLRRRTQRAPRRAYKSPLTIVARNLGPKDRIATFKGLF